MYPTKVNVQLRRALELVLFAKYYWTSWDTVLLIVFFDSYRYLLLISLFRTTGYLLFVSMAKFNDKCFRYFTAVTAPRSTNMAYRYKALLIWVTYTSPKSQKSWLDILIEWLRRPSDCVTMKASTTIDAKKDSMAIKQTRNMWLSDIQSICTTKTKLSQNSIKEIIMLSSIQHKDVFH